MQRNEVRVCKQIVELFYQFDLQTACARGREIGIVSHNPHPKGDGAPAQFASNPPHADNAECFVVELDTFEIFSAPLFATQTRVRLRNFSRNAKQKRKCVFRC